MTNSEVPSVQVSLFDPGVSREHLIQIIKTLFNIEHIMSTISDLKLLLRLVLEESLELVSAETGSVMLYDEGTRELYFEVPLGPVGDKLQEIRIGIDEGICGYACRTGESVNVHDTRKDPRFFKAIDDETDFQSRSILAVPMYRKGRLIGVIEVINKRGAEHFTNDDTRILEVLAGQAAIAIENARLYKESLEKERLAAIGQAVASLSHCIKNIVTGMQGSSSLLEMAIKEQKYEMLPKAWEILKRSTGRVGGLVQDMLTISKERKVERRECDINEIIEETCEIVEQRAKDMNIEIIRDFKAPPTRVMLDTSGIVRSILNLVGNAVDAIALDPERDSDQKGRIIVTSEITGEPATIYVHVSDNGCGIPEENIQKIFNAFFSTKGSAGTGLGLAATGKIIKEHGGTIHVKSIVGQGSTFTVELPVVLPAS